MGKESEIGAHGHAHEWHAHVFDARQPSLRRRESPRMSSSLHILVLGAGHANIQLVQALARWRPGKGPRDLVVTLVNPTESVLYSGRVPSCISGGSAASAEIRIPKLLSTANPHVLFHFVLGSVEAIDATARTARIRHGVDGTLSEHAPPQVQDLSYDIVCIDVGCSSRGLHDIPGALGSVLPTRPLVELLRLLDMREETMTGQLSANERTVFTCVVVGAGLGGCELAMALRARWSRGPLAGKVSITVLSRSNEIEHRVIGYKLGTLGISVACGVEVHRLSDGVLECSAAGTPKTIPADVVVFATGVMPHPFFADQARTGSAALGFLTPEGFVAVDRTLTSVAHPATCFAAGDCAQLLVREPDGSLVRLDLPKSGVVAVRQAETLIANVLRAVEGHSPDTFAAYVPQRSWLQIVNCGDGTAIALWGTRTFGPSSWVYKWKELLDGQWMRRF
ncbi:hypothetical protein DFJ74DRAFT_32889 [Hyaloraphidium curvatum]|nr:hypothetical protein DFJ74DRAFT_32889 [Hyaloraphidium curvatum]